MEKKKLFSINHYNLARLIFSWYKWEKINFDMYIYIYIYIYICVVSLRACSHWQCDTRGEDCTFRVSERCERA